MESIKFNTSNIGGEVVKDNDTYLLTDNRTLNNLVLSKTVLHPNRSTTGHFHDGLEEVYTFVKGDGIMKVGSDKFPVKAGDIVLIPDGEFHKVYNNSGEDLEFVCIFQTYKR